jgi:hypothetical protein
MVHNEGHTVIALRRGELHLVRSDLDQAAIRTLRIHRCDAALPPRLERERIGAQQPLLEGYLSRFPQPLERLPVVVPLELRRRVAIRVDDDVARSPLRQRTLIGAPPG